MTVKGLVQGVGFRYFVAAKASRLGLVGFVCNTYSGEVEIEVEGERSGIESLIREVKVGPRASQVRDVVIEWHEESNRFSHFEIR